MANKSLDNIRRMYSDLKQNWEEHRSVWDDISKFVGITVDTDYMNNRGYGTKSKDLDEFVDDPTSALSVNQAGDYLMGIMWGTGDKVFDIVPSRYVTELVDKAEVEEFYQYASDQALYHMNHTDAGFTTALRPYTYDQFSFGTSGLGTFLNKDFLTGVAENALTFRGYGIDNTMIDEGKAGQVDIVATVYNWRVNRIVSEFAMTNGVIDETKLATLPKPIREAYAQNQLNEQFQIVFMFFPRSDFDPKLDGKRGTRYRGVWFMDSSDDGDVFLEEDFFERPIAMARAIKIRGDVYGRSSGTTLLSSIKSVNFMVGNAIEIIDKMGNPSLGVLNNALFGDSVLDTSVNGLTVFNEAFTGNSKNPVFPIHDVGDPSAILQFLVPYLNEKIVTGFKVDILLDFSSASDMTATESLQRFAIRGKSLAGFLLQQKNEGIVPSVKRSISLLMAIGELGINPADDPERAQQLNISGRGNRVIPEAILEVINSGRPWYELKFNNELEKLTRTEAVDALVQVIQAITAIAQLNPQIIEAVNWYKLLKAINDNLDHNSQILMSEKEFKKSIEAAAQQQQAMLGVQAAQADAQVGKDHASANKSNAEAQKDL